VIPRPHPKAHAPSCGWCWQEYVNRMNLESMQSIWFVLLYCLVAENRPHIRENSTLHLSLFFSSCRNPAAADLRSTFVLSTRSRVSVLIPWALLGSKRRLERINTISINLTKTQSGTCCYMKFNKIINLASTNRVYILT
jgi:hypothetical protein